MDIKKFKKFKSLNGDKVIHIAKYGKQGLTVRAQSLNELNKKIVDLVEETNRQEEETKKKSKKKNMSSSEDDNSDDTDKEDKKSKKKSKKLKNLFKNTK